MTDTPPLDQCFWDLLDNGTPAQLRAGIERIDFAVRVGVLDDGVLARLVGMRAGLISAIEGRIGSG